MYQKLLLIIGILLLIAVSVIALKNFHIYKNRAADAVANKNVEALQTKIDAQSAEIASLREDLYTVVTALASISDKTYIPARDSIMEILVEKFGPCVGIPEGQCRE